ncbi:hypothetical protein [Bacillus sp. Marseille-P3800]|uniref:hypothetical protein n=1 Tax=Bacillus sp. Marseille-P3800 TaxID=2014782 RepID=UPI00159BC196|nr:hypothetical protein [Bacillus sp. Marseille-P3800]
MKISREHVKKVAERYGYEVEFDSDTPGFEWTDEGGNVKRMTISEAFERMFPIGEEKSQ